MVEDSLMARYDDDLVYMNDYKICVRFYLC